MFEIPHSGTPGRAVALGGTQLAYRPLSQLVTELALAGIEGLASDAAIDRSEGFSIWSMGSL